MRLRRKIILTRGSLLFAALLGGTTAFAQSGVQPGARVRRDVMVAMRDGVKLATDLYLPENNSQRLPVILVRLPYDKSREEKNGQYFASHGYAFVAQDTRGRYKSEGTWHWMTDDGRDGADTASWIGKQPWSSGRIGMIGTSYVGGTQHAMAMERPQELATVIPVDASSNPGRYDIRTGGAFQLRLFNGILANFAMKGTRYARDPGTHGVLAEMLASLPSYLVNLPVRRGMTPLRHAPEYEDFLIETMGYRANDDFWNQGNVVDHPERYKDIPVYLVGGWYDSHADSTPANFATLTRTIKGPVYLIMGPWIHGAQASFAHGQVTFGRDAAIADPLAWRLEWMDRWLKGIENTVGKAPPFRTPVRIFVMGSGNERKDPQGKKNHGGFWRDENEWPLARTRFTDYYFHPGGVLSTQPPQGTNSSTSFVFDPKNPVPTIGGNISSADQILLQGAWDQRGGKHVWNLQEPLPLSARNDVLVFQTEPLENDLEVTGEPTASLWASSSAVNTDFTVKIIDVHPPNEDFPGGFDMNLADGIVRARFRDSPTQARLMKPGSTYRFSIKPNPTSNIFKKGHRIRVDVSSSNFPRFDINPNTGEPLNDHRRMVPAVNTIFHDRNRPSLVVLPVIPASPK